MKIGSFAHIISGIYSSTINDGEVHYIQARDFDENRRLANNLAPVLTYTVNLEKHFLKKGDILIVAKGASFLSALYDGSYQQAVASTVFLIVRLNNADKIVPEYVSWYLNLPTTQSFLFSLSSGTSIPSINKKTIGQLEIPIPTLAKQQLVIEVTELSKKESFLKRKIGELKENQMNQLILNAINN